MPNESTELKWVKYGEKHLVGRKIVSVRYTTAEETEQLGWHSRALVMNLDDGTMIYPSADDEGNCAGALFGQKGKTSLTFPVL